MADLSDSDDGSDDGQPQDASSTSSNNKPPFKKQCHYEVLGVPRDADDAILKKAFRSLALRWHPDKNPDNIEEATAKFKLVREAWDVLSDPHEKAWYDSHRDSILRDGSGHHGGGGDGDEAAEKEIDLWQYFSTDIYQGFGNDAKGFFVVYSNAFDNIEEVERDACEQQGKLYHKGPAFGNADTTFEVGVKQFYNFWDGFVSKRTFSAVDKWKLPDAPNRRVRRAMEKENIKERTAARKAYHDTVRSMVDFVRKRDPRVTSFRKTQAQQKEKKMQEQLAAQQAKKSADEEKRKRWKEEQERLYEQMELERQQEYGDVDADGTERRGNKKKGSDDEKDADRPDQSHDYYKCEACNKPFKSENQWKEHEKSKKHRDTVNQLRRQLEREERLMGLNGGSRDEAEESGQEKSKNTGGAKKQPGSKSTVEELAAVEDTEEVEQEEDEDDEEEEEEVDIESLIALASKTKKGKQPVDSDSSSRRAAKRIAEDDHDDEEDEEEDDDEAGHDDDTAFYATMMQQQQKKKLQHQQQEREKEASKGKKVKAPTKKVVEEDDEDDDGDEDDQRIATKKAAASASKLTSNSLSKSKPSSGKTNETLAAAEEPEEEVPEEEHVTVQLAADFDAKLKLEGQSSRSNRKQAEKKKPSRQQRERSDDDDNAGLEDDDDDDDDDDDEANEAATPSSKETSKKQDKQQPTAKQQKEMRKSNGKTVNADAEKANVSLISDGDIDNDADEPAGAQDEDDQEEHQQVTGKIQKKARPPTKTATSKVAAKLNQLKQAEKDEDEDDEKDEEEKESDEEDVDTTTASSSGKKAKKRRRATKAEREAKKAAGGAVGTGTQPVSGKIGKVMTPTGKVAAVAVSDDGKVLRCLNCAQPFESNSQLFKHLKRFPKHAAPKPAT